MVAQVCLVLIILAAATAAMFSVRLVRAATFLAIGNTALALLLILLRARIAGIVLISVGVGVLSALMWVAISLTESLRGGTDAQS